MTNSPSSKRQVATKFVITSQGVSLNIRSAPDSTAAVLGKLPRGSQLAIYTDSATNGFAQTVEPVAGQIGYAAVQWLADSMPDVSTLPNSSEPVAPVTTSIDPKNKPSEPVVSLSTLDKYVKLNSGINIRAGADAKSQDIGDIAFGVKIKVKATPTSFGGYNWYELAETPPGPGFVADINLQDTPPVPATTSTAIANPPAKPVSIGPVIARPGLHVEASAINHGLRDQLIASAKACHDAGKPYGAAVVADDPWMANEMAKYTTVVYRHVALGDKFSLRECQTPEAARAHAQYVYNLHKADMDATPNVQYYQLHNEDGINADFEMETMRLAEADGRRIGLFGSAVGTPEVAEWKALEAVLRHAMANGHVAVLHEYGAFVSGKVSDQFVSSPNGFDWYGGRHRQFYAAVSADCHPKLIIGETGPSDSIFRGAENLVADQRAYLALLRADPYVIGQCPFTFGVSWQSATWELNTALPQYEAFCKGV